MVVFEHAFFDGKAKGYVGKEELINLVVEISDKVDMKIVHGPHAFDGEVGNEGWTILAGIEYSSITLHHFTEDDKIYLDILTCKNINFNELLEFMKKKVDVYKFGYIKR